MSRPNIIKVTLPYVLTQKFLMLFTLKLFRRIQNETKIIKIITSDMEKAENHNFICNFIVCI